MLRYLLTGSPIPVRSFLLQLGLDSVIARLVQDIIHLIVDHPGALLHADSAAHHFRAGVGDNAGNRGPFLETGAVDGIAILFPGGDEGVEVGEPPPQFLVFIGAAPAGHSAGQDVVARLQFRGEPLDEKPARGLLFGAALRVDPQ